MVTRHGTPTAASAALCGWLALMSAWSCSGATMREPGESLLTADLATEVYPGANGQATTPPALGAAALEATWQELAVPGATLSPALASTPSGWLALSRRSVGDPKAPSAWESYLYRSTDGIRWQQVALSERNEDLWLRGVAYGNGRYVLAGKRFGQSGSLIFSSRDGERWEERSVDVADLCALAGAVYTGNRFFAFSTGTELLTSTDGEAWTTVELSTTVMPLDVTFGLGQYLLVGSGRLQRSTDGLNWQASSIDCALPGACISDPSGNVLQSVHYQAVFAQGSYYIDQARSTDGSRWESLPGLYPEAQVGAYVLGRNTSDELVAWASNEAPVELRSRRYVDTLSDAARGDRMRWNGAVRPAELSSDNMPTDAPLPELIEFPIPGGADCTTARCAIVGDRLYLVSTRP
jgi:hypothetical protein